MKHLRTLNKYFWHYRYRLLAGLVFIVLSNYFAILAPQITAYVVDKVQQILPGAKPAGLARQADPLVNIFIEFAEGLTWSFSGVVALCGITIIMLALIRGLFMFLMRQTIVVMSRHIEYDQKNEVYTHYQQLDTQFYKTHAVGDMMSRISEDVSRVRMYTGPAIMYLTNLVTVIIFALYNMLAKDVWLTIYTLAPLPILSVTIYYVNKIIHQKSSRIQALLSDLTTQAQQSYSGIRVIKSYVQEKAMLQFFDEQSKQYRNQALGLARLEAIYFPAILLLIGASTAITIMIGGLYYLNGRIEHVGTIVEFVLYINMLTFPVSAIGWVAGMVQRAAASQQRINEFLQTAPAIVHTPGGLSPKEFKAEVAFKNVSFTYPHTGIQALNNLSFSILPGQRIAIIGRTGSGKSTIAQLLLSMYRAQQGQVLLDGVALQEYDLHWLRRQISYVPQDVFLFSDTISNNISFGNAAASSAQIEQVANLAVVHKDIMKFEAGYNTMVGERGVTLSGGQKQRVSIARALLKPASLVILDDCLSAVDAKTEKEVLHNLDTFLQGKTAIVITHRIFATMGFDNIMVLDDGVLVEQGTHEQLMAANGEYAAMLTMQQQQDAAQNN